LRGELIGITTFNVTGGQNLNFALPVEWLENLPVASNRDMKASEPTDWQIHARALVTAKDWRGLISWSDRWQKDDPNNAMSWYFQGIANFNLSKWDQTIRSMSESVRIQPKFAPAWHVLGVAYGFNQQFEISRDALQEALKLAPSDAEYWSSLGYVLSRMRSFDEATNAFKKAIEISPQSKYWKGLGDVYELKRLQNLSRIVNSPWDSKPIKETAYDQREKSDQIEAYRQAVKLDQDYVSAWVSLAQALTMAKQCNEAQDAIVEIKKRDPAKGLEIAAWYRRKYSPCEGR
jgi:superkiller protein 3